MKSFRQLSLLGLVTLLIGLSTLPVRAEEVADLTLSMPADARRANRVKVWELILRRDPPAISVVVGDNSIRRSFSWVGAEAKALIIFLNKADLRTNTLNKRILQKLIDEGRLQGSVIGDPD